MFWDDHLTGYIEHKWMEREEKELEGRIKSFPEVSDYVSYNNIIIWYLIIDILQIFQLVLHDYKALETDHGKYVPKIPKEWGTMENVPSALTTLLRLSSSWKKLITQINESVMPIVEEFQSLFPEENPSCEVSSVASTSTLPAPFLSPRIPFEASLPPFPPITPTSLLGSTSSLVPLPPTSGLSDKQGYDVKKEAIERSDQDLLASTNIQTDGSEFLDLSAYEDTSTTPQRSIPPPNWFSMAPPRFYSVPAPSPIIVNPILTYDCPGTPQGIQTQFQTCRNGPGRSSIRGNMTLRIHFSYEMGLGRGSRYN